MTGEDEVVVEPPTVTERLEWTYEKLLQLRVSMLHLAKQVSGPTGQIEEWSRQLHDILDGVERMRVAQLVEGIDPEIRRQVKQACDELAREFPEGEPGAHEGEMKILEGEVRSFCSIEIGVQEPFPGTERE